MAEVTVELAGWLCTPTGRDAIAAATADLDDGHDALAVGSRLRDAGMDPGRATAVMGAATARRRARDRWPDADELLFTPAALEQASDPGVAAWRARRLAGAVVWDLCAGIGADALAMAAAGAEVTAVDHDGGRLRLLEHNAAQRGLRVDTVVGDALAVSVPEGALVHADPSRRRSGTRVKRLADHQPPVRTLLAVHRHVPGSGVVLSPGVDLDDPDLPSDAELEFVALDGALKESVAWTGRLRAEGAVASATLLPQGQHRVRRGPAVAIEVGEPGAFLVEVVPAAVRARLHPEIGREIGARRLAHRRALLTSDTAPPPSPWYRVRPVLAVLPARARAVRRWLRGADPAAVEIVVHGLEADPVRWWQALGRPPRGPQGYRLELIRTDHGAHAVVTDVRPTP